MAEIPRVGASAVAIIETPDSFIVEGRPIIPGQLVHSGKKGLFGGHIEPGQTAYDAIRAELDQELRLRPMGPLEFLEGGDVPSKNKHGENVVRHVSLFRVAIGSAAELSLQVPGNLVEIPKNIEAIEAFEDEMTPFTFRALCRALTGNLPARDKLSQ